MGERAQGGKSRLGKEVLKGRGSEVGKDGFGVEKRFGVGGKEIGWKGENRGSRWEMAGLRVGKRVHVRKRGLQSGILFHSSLLQRPKVVKQDQVVDSHGYTTDQRTGTIYSFLLLG